MIYQNVVLDCGHSFCKSCILTWFKKQKICPVCRAKHKGAPRAVRSVDNVISVLLKQCSTVDEQRERQVRIARIDAESKERAIQELERSRIKAQRNAERAQLGMGAGAPPDRIAAALSARAAVDAVMRARLPDSDDDDDDYVPDGSDDDDEPSYRPRRRGVFIDDFELMDHGGFSDNEDAEWHAQEMRRMERVEQRPAPRVPAAAAAAAAVAAAAPAPAPAPAVAAAAPAPLYWIEESPNARSKCLTCERQIPAHALRLRQGVSGRWHHLDCLMRMLPARALRGTVGGIDALSDSARRIAQSTIG